MSEAVEDRLASTQPRGSTAGEPAPDRRERVLTVLEAAPGALSTAMLEEFCDGRVGHESLMQRDYLGALRAADGDVGLEAQLPHGTIRWSWRSDDRLVAAVDGRFGHDRAVGPRAEGMLRACIQLDVLEPVLVDDG
jgi:hypothetical protein